MPTNRRFHDHYLCGIAGAGTTVGGVMFCGPAGKLPIPAGFESHGGAGIAATIPVSMSFGRITGGIGAVFCPCCIGSRGMEQTGGLIRPKAFALAALSLSSAEVIKRSD